VQLAEPRLLVSALKTDFGRTSHAQAPLSAMEFEAHPRALAAALSVSPQRTEMSRAVLIARPAPDPLLGIVGYFDAAGRARLDVLRWQLDNYLPSLRYIGYAQAEEDCERLAAQLVEHFGREELRSFRFTAIPRGGFIVLGMLAYALDLQYSQLEGSHPPEIPLVVVDDYAGSGVRFGRFLERLGNRQVVFAHLYSHPDLRAAIEAREAGRVTCFSARDLQDCAPKLYGEGYYAWRERWLARMDRHGYWVGEPNPVCFAWNEPDTVTWNPVSDREEPGWRLIPPELCLKNRVAPGTEPIQVQVQPKGKGPLKPSSRVLFGELEGQMVLGDLEAEECFVLDSVGTDMWQAVVEHGNIEGATNALMEIYEVNGTVLRDDLQRFVEDLLARGLLETDE
jgi:hypothetical protein